MTPYKNQKFKEFLKINHFEPEPSISDHNENNDQDDNHNNEDNDHNNFDVSFELALNKQNDWFYQFKEQLRPEVFWFVCRPWTHFFKFVKPVQVFSFYFFTIFILLNKLIYAYEENVADKAQDYRHSKIFLDSPLKQSKAQNACSQIIFSIWNPLKQKCVGFLSFIKF